MKKSTVFCMTAGIIMAFNGVIFAETVTFTAADIVAAIGGLSDANYQWGLWGIRARPIVTGGGFTITAGSTLQQGYNTVIPPGSGSWPVYGTNYVYFYDIPGAEWGYPTTPRYMIMDRPANTFTSYSGDTATKVANAALFSFSFTPDLGAVWTGQWQFLVEGTKYTLGTVEHPGIFVDEFRGGYGSGGLAGNAGQGYTLPEPTVIFLLGQGVLSFSFCRKHRKVN